MSLNEAHDLDACESQPASARECIRLNFWEGYHESRRCSRDTYPESYITKYTSIRRQYIRLNLADIRVSARPIPGQREVPEVEC